MAGYVGFRQSSRPSGAYGAGPATIVCQCYLGRWREYGQEIVGVGGGLPATAAVDDMSAFDLYEHESVVGRPGAGGGQGAGD